MLRSLSSREHNAFELAGRLESAAKRPSWTVANGEKRVPRPSRDVFSLRMKRRLSVLGRTMEHPETD